jgi:hypothetical protein
MKLNQNQIQFIDGYLHRNDVIYVDIRAEMIDHIATGVEEKMKDEDFDFHDAFVSYVNSNHKEIFSMNKNILILKRKLKNNTIFVMLFYYLV